MAREVVITVNNPGVPLVVAITGASAFAAASGGSAITFPETITAPKTYYLARDNRADAELSVKSGGTEIAAPRNKKRTIVMQEARSWAIEPHWDLAAAGLKTNADAAAGRVAARALVAVRKTNDYTLAMTDASGAVEMNKGTANTLTVPAEATVNFPIGTPITVVQYGAGVTTIAAAGSVTIRKTAATLAIAAQYGQVRLRKIGADEWIIDGALS